MANRKLLNFDAPIGRIVENDFLENGNGHHDTDDVASTAADPVLERMGGSFANFDHRTLLSYFLSRFQQLHGFEHPEPRPQDHAIMRSFLKRYGHQAGPMVQALFDDFQGLCPKTRDIATTTLFCNNNTWMQVDLRKTVEEKYEAQRYGTSVGYFDEDDLLARMGR